MIVTFTGVDALIVVTEFEGVAFKEGADGLIEGVGVTSAAKSPIVTTTGSDAKPLAITRNFEGPFGVDGGNTNFVVEVEPGATEYEEVSKVFP